MFTKASIPSAPAPHGGASLRAHDIHRYIGAKQWDRVLAIAKRGRDIISRRNQDGFLALHLAADSAAPPEVLRALLYAYPDAAAIADPYGQLALHYYCAATDAPPGAVTELLRVYPAAAEVADEDGFLPVHFAAAFGAPAAVVGALLRAFPAGARRRNAKGASPLDLARAVRPLPDPAVLRLLAPYIWEGVT